MFLFLRLIIDLKIRLDSYMIGFRKTLRVVFGSSPSAPSVCSSFRPGTSVDMELVSGPRAEQDGDRLSSMSNELAAAVSPSENSRLGMENEAESEDSCWSSEPPAVTKDEFSFSSRSKPAGNH